MKTSTAVRGGSSYRPTPAGRPSLLRLTRSRWVPVGVMAVFTVALLWLYGVPLLTTMSFGAYAVGGIVLPGTLVWRAAHRRSGWFVADVAAGTAVGYAGEIGCYIAGSALGAPLLVLAWPLGVIVTFAAVPTLRQYWRGGGADVDRTPRWWAWSMVALLAALLAWGSVAFFRTHGLAWPGTAGPDPDSLFHQALIGDAKHHLPLVYPWLSNEPLIYHWFVYAEMAATSWVTGIEPQVLLLRLSVLPMIAASVLLFAVIARRLTGRWWAGPAAVGLTFFVLAPYPYRWGMSAGYAYYSFSPVEDGSLFKIMLWTSPTATLGVVLFAAAVLLLVDLLKPTGVGGAGRVGRWALLGLLLATVMGAKASFLPVLLGGLVLIVAVELVFHRRWSAAALITTGLTVACLAFAQIVLFGGVSQGLELHPLESMVKEAGSSTTGFTHLGGPFWRLGWMSLLTLGCWVGIWAGVAFLFRLRGWRRMEPPIVLLLGIGLAGAAAFLIISENGGAEGWFFFSARPYLSIAAVVGLASVTSQRALNRRVLLAIVAALGLGALIAVVVRAFTPARPPTVGTEGSPAQLAIALGWPYAAIFGVVTVLIVLLVRYRRRMDDALRGLVPVLAVCLIAGTGLAGAARLARDGVVAAERGGWREASWSAIVAPGTPEAGRWLRDHSSPGDLIATNAHCIPTFPERLCDARHFAISAYTERRMLVEGWAFTVISHQHAVETGASPSYVVDYWDPTRLADNDAAFQTPTSETIGRLRDHYGVRWLFVDRGPESDLANHNVDPSMSELQRFATLRFQSGNCEVYEINP